MTQEGKASSFEVTTSDGVTTTYDGNFSIQDNGVLKIRQDDEPVLLLSPGFWQTVSDGRPKKETRKAMFL